MPRWLASFLWAFLLWTALAVVFASQLYFAGLPWGQALAWSIPRWYSWGLLTPAVFWLDRRLGRGRSLPLRVAMHVPLGVCWTTAAIALRLATRPLRGAGVPDDLGAFFLDRVEEILRQQYGVKDVLRRMKPTVTRPAPQPIKSELREKCDAVIEALVGG